MHYITIETDKPIGIINDVLYYKNKFISIIVPGEPKRFTEDEANRLLKKLSKIDNYSFKKHKINY